MLLIGLGVTVIGVGLKSGLEVSLFITLIFWFLVVSISEIVRVGFFTLFPFKKKKKREFLFFVNAASCTVNCM